MTKQFSHSIAVGVLWLCMAHEGASYKMAFDCKELCKYSAMMAFMHEFIVSAL